MNSENTIAPGDQPNPNLPTDAGTLQAENESLRTEIARRDEEAKQHQADEEIITQKMLAGLTRPQAEAVIRRQREHDKLKPERERRNQDYRNRALKQQKALAQALTTTDQL
jgi:hypothetical protein